MRDRYDFSGSKPNPHAKRMKRQTESGVGAKPGETQASRLPAGETPALPARVTKICRTPAPRAFKRAAPAVQFVSGHRYTNPTGSTRRARTS